MFEVTLMSISNLHADSAAFFFIRRSSLCLCVCVAVGRAACGGLGLSSCRLVAGIRKEGGGGGGIGCMASLSPLLTRAGYRAQRNATHCLLNGSELVLIAPSTALDYG